MILEWLEHLVTNPAFILVGTFTLIQISPIKIDPWSWVAKQIRKALLGDSIEKLEKDITSIKKDVLDERVSAKRWQILNFSNSCLQKTSHTKEEWDHCLQDLDWYEHYCTKNNIPNGVVTQCARYLRDEYQAHMQNNDFLSLK